MFGRKGDSRRCTATVHGPRGPEPSSFEEGVKFAIRDELNTVDFYNAGADRARDACVQSAHVAETRKIQPRTSPLLETGEGALRHLHAFIPGGTSPKIVKCQGLTACPLSSDMTCLTTV